KGAARSGMVDAAPTRLGAEKSALRMARSRLVAAIVPAVVSAALVVNDVLAVPSHLKLRLGVTLTADDTVTAPANAVVSPIWIVPAVTWPRSELLNPSVPPTSAPPKLISVLLVVGWMTT